MAAALAGQLAAAPLSDVTVPALLALVWRPAPSPALRGFLAHCRQAFRRPG